MCLQFPAVCSFKTLFLDINCLAVVMLVPVVGWCGWWAHCKACPAPPEVLPSKGKNCQSNICLNSNTGYDTFVQAWTRCGEVAECGFIMRYDDGKYYLRRTSDPDRTDMQGISYSCQVQVVPGTAVGPWFSLCLLETLGRRPCTRND